MALVISKSLDNKIIPRKNKMNPTNLKTHLSIDNVELNLYIILFIKSIK